TRNQRQSLRNASLFPQSSTLARRHGRGSDGFATKCLDRRVHGGEQRRITEVFAESDRYEHLAQGAVGASELQGDTPGAKLFGQPRERVGGGDVDLRHRLDVDEKPAYGMRTGGDQTAHAVHEVVGVPEEERRVEAVGDQPRYGLRRGGVAYIVEGARGRHLL